MASNTKPQYNNYIPETSHIRNHTSLEMRPGVKNYDIHSAYAVYETLRLPRIIQAYEGIVEILEAKTKVKKGNH